MALSPADIRARLYKVVDQLGFASVADDVDADGIIDTQYFQNSEAGEGDWHGAAIYRPTAPTDDRYRTAGYADLSTGKLFQTGPSYTDLTTLAYELVGWVTPQELNDCIRRAVRRAHFPTLVPLSIWQDGDFSASDTSAFTTSGSGTASKVTDAEKNRDGIRSLQLSDGGSGGFYVLSTPEAVNPRMQLRHSAIARAVGTATGRYTLMDVTHGAAIGDPWVFTGPAWQHFGRTDVIPEGCYQVQAKLEVVTASGTVIFDSLPSHLRSELRLVSPAWLDAPYKLISIREAEYTGPYLGNHHQDAGSVRFADWRVPSDYTKDNFVSEATPNFIQVNRRELPDADLWLHGYRPYSDRSSMESESDSTDCPEDLLIACVLYELALILTKRYRDNAAWAQMLVENAAVIEAQFLAREPAQTRHRVTMYTPGGRR